jgi:outer membrane protein OmpA-like peptidoglycan-associated protein
MRSLCSVLIFLSVWAVIIPPAFAQQQQDKEQSKLYMEQADLILADTKAMDDARDLMVFAADFDTTNVTANFKAGHMHLETINKDYAIKYFMRIYHQDPDFRFDLLYWIGVSYQYGLDFDNAIKYYNMYRAKVVAKPSYQGKDKTDIKVVDRKIIECNNGKEFVANPKNFSIVNVGKEINSEFEDYAPVLNQDEDEIVFTTRRKDGNTFENVADDNKPYEDIFDAKKSGGTWSKAKNIGPTVNTKYNDSNLALSPDGNTLFLYKDEGNGDIYFSKKLKDGAWSAPEALPGLINSSYRESSVSITKDGNTLYFSSERPGGFGGSDIYYCLKDSKGEWTRVKNCGSVINSEADEDGPFIDYDQKTLYFSSKGRKGMGGFDIFKTTLVNPDKMEWSDPENLGYPINTPDDDAFFVSTKDGKRGYYASVRDDGFGYSDIYMITIPDEKPKEPAVAAKDPEPVKKDSTVTVPPIIETPPPAAPLTYVVYIVDASDQSPLEAKVRLQGAKDNVMVGLTGQTGGAYTYSITEKKSKDYRLSVERQGFAFDNETVTIDGSSSAKTITKTVQLRKLAVGVSSVMRNIYFDFGKATFKKESYSELNKLETMMKQSSGVRLEIAGHTDNIGTKIFNKGLSERRANAVRAFLTSKGVDPRRVTAVGYGEEKPLASNDDDKEGRELNRRVEFKVTGN